MTRLLAAALLLMPVFVFAGEPFFVTVVDEATGRGVPLVELKSIHNDVFVTDSAGVAAIDLPEFEGQKCFFWIRSHGYEFQADGFGYRGARLDVAAGGLATIKIKRINLAQRLYRQTGAGIYVDSVRKGDQPPTEQPLLNAGVTGQDSIQSTIYRGKLFWMWGDTNLPGYPLGVFHMTGATSELPGEGGLDPNVGVNLKYFTDNDGQARAIAEMEGEGPTWLAGPFVLKDDDGTERMYAGYSKIKPPLDAYRHGLCRWNDDKQAFENVADFPKDAPLLPIGHAEIRETPDGNHVYFGGPFPNIRVPATDEAVADLTQYEGFTCLVAGGRLDRPAIDRKDDGTVLWSWKPDTPAVGPADAAKLLKDGLLKPHERVFQLRDRDTGANVIAHNGNVTWNEHRQRWVMVAVEIFGTSPLGEVWYAEAESPLGPWVYATKIVTHDQYSFYNVKHHDYFDADEGRQIYFEGTYTKEFSGNPVPTPRYDYNQIMYSLDLSDERTTLPVSVKLEPGTQPVVANKATAGFDDWKSIDFFAADRPGVDTVAIRSHDGRLTTTNDGDIAFHAIAADAKTPPKATVPLFEYIDESNGERLYTTAKSAPREGLVKQENPLCRVWPNPYRAK